MQWLRVKLVLHFSIMLTVLLGIARAYDESMVLGNITEAPAVNAEVEPGRSYVANDQGVLHAIRELHTRPNSESAAILDEMDSLGLDNLPPPFMMEYSRRQWLLKREAWAEKYLIGRMRALYDAKVCKDQSAAQCKTIIEKEFELSNDGFINAYNEDVDKNFTIYLRNHLDSGLYFDSKASAWWICSHGITYANSENNQIVSLEDWFVGETERDAIKIEAENALSASAAIN